MTTTRSLADAKSHFSEIIDLVEKEHERVIITRNGKPAAIIVSPEELEALDETLDILSTPGALEEIRQAEKDIDSGDHWTAAELRAKYLGKE